jgi:hypothetical protein
MRKGLMFAVLLIVNLAAHAVPREGKEIPASYCHYSSQAEKQNSRTADIM